MKLKSAILSRLSCIAPAAIVGIMAPIPAFAQETAQVAVPAEGMAAFQRREYGQAATIIVPAFESCRTEHPQGSACTDLAMASAVIVATAGNAKVESIILAAQDYIDTRVGRESAEALAILGAITSYYDRLTLMDKFVPVAERRLALSRKLHGAYARTSVIAAVSLCIAQWNMGKGQAAIDLLAPLIGKLPEKAPEEMVLSGRVHDCMGTAYYSLDRHREAEPAFRTAIGLYERAAGEGDDLTLDAMASLANTLRRLNRHAEAQAMAMRIIALAKPGAQLLSRVEWAAGKPADPVAAARAEMEKSEKQFGPQSPVTDMAAAQYGIALIDAGRFADAEPYLARLEAAAGNEANPASVRIKLMTGQIALVAKQDGGRFDRALPIIERVVALTRRTGAGSDKLLIDYQMYAGAMLTTGGRPDRAYPYLTDAGNLLLARLASYRDFDAAAQRETREYSPVFRFKILTAWWLAQRR